MGLIKEGDDYIVLTDIAGVEDHLGDMDFKVAGTSEGITALQMDIKITGVTFDILRDALAQAQDARMTILGKMGEAISAPREELSQYAPRISAIQIDTEKIGAVIGKGGETIRALSDEFDAQIDIDDDGTVRIYAQTGDQGDALVDRIRSMTKEVEVGDEFTGKVVKTTTFGAFVELAKGTDGLLHISNLKPGERVNTVEDVLNRGDEIEVKVVEVDRERGRIGLRLAGDPEIAGKSPEELSAMGTGDKGPRGDRGNGRGGRDRDRRPRERRPRERDRDLRVVEAAQLSTLDSGVRVVTERVRLGALDCARVLGARGVPGRGERQAGISHFLEHLLFKGTERFSSREIDELFDAMGAEVNAGTGKETTSVYSRFLDRHLEQAFDVMQDIVLRPAYPDIDSERQVVIEEIAMYEDEPADKVHDVLAGAVFGDHPLGRPIIGRAEVVSSVRRPRSRSITTCTTCRTNIVVAAAGNLEHERIVELVEGSVPGAASASRRSRARPRGCARASLSREGNRAGSPRLGGPGIARGDDRRFTLRILDTILGGSTSSRLFQEVREKRGLAYSVYSYASHYVDSGQVRSTSARADNVAEAMDVIGSELQRLTEDGVDEQELERARENVKGRTVLSMESTLTRMNRLGSSVLMEVPLLTIDELLAALDAVTLEDVNALAESCGARIGLPPPVWGGARPLPRALEAVSPGWPPRHDQRGRGRRRGPDGPDGVRRGGGRRRHGAGRPGRPRACRWRWPTCWATPTWWSTSPPRTPRSPTRGCAWRPACTA